MAAPFPLSPAPAAFASVTGSTRGNLYYTSETPSFTFNKTMTGTWTVRDYFGATISTGALSAQTTLNLPTPGGGWVLGWYRLYVTGGVNDAVFGFSLAVTNFAIISNDSRFTPRPNRTEDPGATGEAADLALKAFLGIGTSRIQIGDASNPASGFDNLTNASTTIAVSNEYWTTGADHLGPDAKRPRLCYVSFPNEAVDAVDLSSKLTVRYSSGAGAVLGTVNVVTAAGSVSGIKVTLTQGANVKVWDNVPNTVTGVLQAQAADPHTSVAIYRKNDQGTTDAVGTGLNVNLTNAKYLGVKSVVQTCYALGVEWYEGPENEPDLRKNPVRYGNDAKLFQAAVQAGASGAKAMGPSQVTIHPGAGEDPTVQPQSMGATYRWLTGGVATDGSLAGLVAFRDGPDRAARDYLDGVMVHVYNFMVSDVSAGRTELDNFVRVLELAGVGHLPRFQGEFGVITPVYGVYHPRRARWQMLFHLILEQYGIPKERNNLWYDLSHGFWSFPGWWANSDQSLNPHALLLRVMAEEVYGKEFTGAVDFGTGIGDRMFLGNEYTAADGTKALGLVAASYLSGETVTLQLTGTLPSTITWRTGQGVTSTVAVDVDGRVDLPITGEPTWVRLPAGVAATVHTVLDLRNRDAENMALGAWPSFGDTAAARPAIDGAWQQGYGQSTIDTVSKTAPTTLTMLLLRPTSVSDVVIFSGSAWQSQGTLVDFDIDTSINGGSSWTTRATVTKTTPSSFVHGSDSTNTGTQRDTFWDEQWIFPVHLSDTPIECNALRIVVRTASYGGEPDSVSITTGGQGNSNQTATFTEVYVIGDPAPSYAATV